VSIEHFEPTRGLALEPYISAQDTLAIHHIARYHWARRVLADLQPQSVLDIACGAGYGSHLLGSALPHTSVTGCDYDASAVKLARSKYEGLNVRFVLGDMTTWETDLDGEKTSLGQWDTIVSFDTIEHILHREIALMRLTDNLTDGGTLLLSTPCGRPTSLLNPAWEHHKVEYGHRDLVALMRRFFSTVLVPEEGTLPHMEFWNHEVNRDHVIYLNLANPIVCKAPIRVV
jgi:2-polyprenyl-3-methyl-5-hydroxy-6-metoxy-1,4-benzoquinol methylase